MDPLGEPIAQVWAVQGGYVVMSMTSRDGDTTTWFTSVTPSAKEVLSKVEFAMVTADAMTTEEEKSINDALSKNRRSLWARLRDRKSASPDPE